MSIPNVEQLTAYLKRLSPDQLQQYATLHKDDPITVSLAVSISNARKKEEAAARAQMYQPQATVVDQALAGMGGYAAGGVAQLRAPNIEHMADGGIAGYADGGVMMDPGMLDFAQRSEPVLRMAEGGVARFQSGGLGLNTGVADPLLKDMPIFLTSTPESEEQYAERKRAAQETTVKPLERALRAGEASNDIVAKGLRKLLYPGPSSVEPMAYTTGPGLKMPPTPALGAVPAAAAAPAAPTPAATATPPVTPPAPAAAPATGAGIRVPVPAMPPAAAATAATPIPSMEEFIKQAVNAAQIVKSDDLIASVKKLETEQKEENAAARKRLDESKLTGKAYEKYEASLNAEQDKAQTDLDRMKALAIMQAGFAMMSGTDRNAMVNIGKGAMVGVEQYKGALNDFNKADKERQKEFALIEQARRAEAAGERDKVLALEDKIGERNIAVKRHIADAVVNLGVADKNNAVKIATTISDQTAALHRSREEMAGHERIAAMRERAAAERTQAEIASRERVAQYPGPQERLIERLGGGDFAKGYEVYKTEAQYPVLYNAYAKESSDATLDPTTNKSKGQMFLERFPTFESYLQSFSHGRESIKTGAPATTSAAPAIDYSLFKDLRQIKG